MGHIWAKSKATESTASLTLLQHSIDVSQQMARFHSLYQPNWPLGDGACLGRILAYAALLHDWGKIHVDFQKMLRPGGLRFNNRHEILSLAFTSWLEIPDVERPWLEAAIALHHRGYNQLLAPGGWFFLGERFEAEGSPAWQLACGVSEDDRDNLAELLRSSRLILRECGWRNFSTYVVSSRLSDDFLGGMRAALERIVRLCERFSLRVHKPGPKPKPDWLNILAAVHTRGWLLNADHVASFRPQALRRRVTSKREVDEALASHISVYNSHQRYAAACDGSAILVAPTGTGKTESGLLWTARQSEIGGLRGRTYFLLPYQASMNAMQRRLVKTFAADITNQPAEWDREIALVHGRSVRALYERLLEAEYSCDKAALTAVQQSDLARLRTAPICISSPFQVIRLLFATKGVEGLLATFSESRFILDEVHAYDVGITSMALTSLAVLIEHLGARALFMTATLPSHLRNVFAELFGSLPVVPVGSDIQNRKSRHTLRLLDYHVLSREAIEAIRTKARSGSVLVVVNQVQRALDLSRALAAHGCDVRLLHSRFTYVDRAKRERELKPAIGNVLVATQAVEVSLDLDYDYCFSELAPIESVLQRFGRCNRHGLQSGPAEVAVFTSFGPSERKPYLPYDADHLEAVLMAFGEFLNGKPERVLLEAEMQTLIDRSYPPAMRELLSRTVAEKASDLRSSFVDTFQPFGMANWECLRDLERRWEALFDGEEALPAVLCEVARSETSWIGRSRYLVPISRSRFWQFRNAGKITWDEELLCNVIEAPYDPHIGLDLGRSQG